MLKTLSSWHDQLYDVIIMYESWRYWDLFDATGYNNLMYRLMMLILWWTITNFYEICWLMKFINDCVTCESGLLYIVIFLMIYRVLWVGPIGTWTPGWVKLYRPKLGLGDWCINLDIMSQTWNYALYWLFG